MTRKVSPARHAVHLDSPSVLLHDAVADAEAEPRALPLRLGGVERFEDLAELAARDPVPGVDHLGDRRRVAVTTGDDAHRALLAHRIHGVEQQRHEDLHELLGVGLRHAAEERIELGLDMEPLEADVMLEQEERALDDVVEVDPLLARLLGPVKLSRPSTICLHRTTSLSMMSRKSCVSGAMVTPERSRSSIR